MKKYLKNHHKQRFCSEKDKLFQVHALFHKSEILIDTILATSENITKYIKQDTIPIKTKGLIFAFTAISNPKNLITRNIKLIFKSIFCLLWYISNVDIGLTMACIIIHGKKHKIVPWSADQSSEKK